MRCWIMQWYEFELVRPPYYIVDIYLVHSYMEPSILRFYTLLSILLKHHMTCHLGISLVTCRAQEQ